MGKPIAGQRGVPVDRGRPLAREWCVTMDDRPPSAGAPLSLPEVRARLKAGDPDLRDLLDGGWQKLERLQATMEWLSSWLEGSVEDVDAPIAAMTASEFKTRVQAGEDPIALWRAVGLPQDRAEALDELARWFGAGQRLFDPDGIAADVERSNSVIAELEDLDTWLRSGAPEADWGMLMLPFDFPEDQRLKAMGRILARLAKPIHSKRWRANRKDLVAAFEDLGLRVGEVHESTAWLALMEAGIEELTVRETRNSEDGAMRRFRRKLQEILCDELLPGHDWKNSKRRNADISAVESARTSKGGWTVEDEALVASSARADVALLIERAGLTALERDSLEAYLRVHHWPDAARELQVDEGTMRQRKSTIMKKLKRAAEQA